MQVMTAERFHPAAHVRQAVRLLQLRQLERVQSTQKRLLTK
jgi:hypothetical protein